MGTITTQSSAVLAVSVFFAALTWTGNTHAEDDARQEQVEDANEPTSQPLAGQGRNDPFAEERMQKATPLWGSDWAFSFGGYGKVDLISDFSGTGNKQQFVLATIPVDGNPPPGSYTNLQVSETRFNFEARNVNSKYEDDHFFLEMDFFNEQSKSSARLRHAFFQYGNLIAGQTWTTLTELRQLPLILDFAAGDSILGGRTVQVRWTQRNEARDFGWAIAIEDFDDEGIYNPVGIQGQARADFPRLVGGVTKIWPQVIWSTGAALTQIRWDGSGAVPDSSEVGFTVTSAGRVYLDESQTNWMGFGVGYASGSVTDIIMYANGGVPNAAIDANGTLELAKGWNADLGLHWNWKHPWSSNFFVAYARLNDVPGVFDPDFIRTGWSIHGNLIYTHDERIKAGIEGMYGERENVSGRDGDAIRLQASIFYYF